MILIKQLSLLKRIYINNEFIISYQKITSLPTIKSGYIDIGVVSKRYLATSTNLKLSEFMIQPPVKDLTEFLNSNKDKISAKRQGSLLDVGCGSGAYSLLFGSKQAPFSNFRYVGCEVDDKLVKVCRKIYPKLDFFQSYAQNISAKDGEYSVVFCSGTMHYILDNWQSALKEMIRIAKDHVIITRLPVSKYNQSFYVKQVVKSKYGREIHYFRVFSRKEIEGVFAKLGLFIVARDYTSEEYIIEGVQEKIILNNYLLAKNE